MSLQIDHQRAPQELSSYPAILHLGSGKNFRDDYLNIDCDEIWQPDIVADLELPFPGNRVFDTDRFGRIFLAPGSFDEVIAQDLLEHVRELPALMKSCLDLLRIGGVFKISVPYELSLGAWSDPTHLRAFNERSWDYFTIWCWYFGWDESTFTKQKIDFVLSEYGCELEKKGMEIDDILRAPRAVNSMYVELVKHELSAEGKQMCRDMYRRERRNSPNLDSSAGT